MMTNNPNEQYSEMTAELMRDFLKEKRADRRWKNIRFFLGILIVVLVIGFGVSQLTPSVTDGEDGKGYIALVRLNGMIGPGEDFSAENVLPILKNAFSDKEAKGVILDINSGGGTPVQASIIHDAILRLKAKYHKKVVVVGEDLLASGAYFVSVSADKIYVNPNTLTGSIGVIMRGFGFTDLIKKIGVERRVYAAGDNKDRLDPFLPQKPEDIAKIRQVIDEVHQNFEAVVLEGRKGKLKGNKQSLFSGDFWSGISAQKLGLVDGLGNLTDVMQTEFGVHRYKDYSASPSILRSLVGQVGTSMSMAMSHDQIPVLTKLQR